MSMTVNINRRVLAAGPDVYVVFCKVATDLYENSNSAYAFFTLGPLDEVNSVFPTFEDAVVYLAPAMDAAVLASVNSIFGPGHTLGWSVDCGVEKTAVRLNQLDSAVAQKLSVSAIDSDTFVAQAPNDAPTGMDTFTTLLGTLVGQVNSSNAKQNEIAARLNEVVAALQAIGVLKVSP